MIYYYDIPTTKRYIKTRLKIKSFQKYIIIIIVVRLYVSEISIKIGYIEIKVCPQKNFKKKKLLVSSRRNYR